jgi:hypothetical protein
MGAAAKYLIRRPASESPAEPERLAEDDALRVLFSATGGAACPEHEVSPLANHLRGPVAAVPPEGHPDWIALGASSGGLRSKATANALTCDACGLEPGPYAVQCTCGLTSTHRDLVRFNRVWGRVVRPPSNDYSTQAAVADAIKLRDVDLLLSVAEVRLWCLCWLADRARAEHGGDLPEVAAEAVVLLARTLTGPTRWSVRAGLDKHQWPVHMRVGVTFQTAQSTMLQPQVHDRVIQRLVEGK